MNRTKGQCFFLVSLLTISFFLGVQYPSDYPVNEPYEELSPENNQQWTLYSSGNARLIYTPGVFMPENREFISTWTAWDVENPERPFDFILIQNDDFPDYEFINISRVNNNTVELSFVNPPDFENPLDKNGSLASPNDNVYSVSLFVCKRGSMFCTFQVTMNVHITNLTIEEYSEILPDFVEEYDRHNGQLLYDTVGNYYALRRISYETNHTFGTDVVNDTMPYPFFLAKSNKYGEEIWRIPMYEGECELILQNSSMIIKGNSGLLQTTPEDSNMVSSIVSVDIVDGSINWKIESNASIDEIVTSEFTDDLFFLSGIYEDDTDFSFNLTTDNETTNFQSGNSLTNPFIVRLGGNGTIKNLIEINTSNVDHRIKSFQVLNRTHLLIKTYSSIYSLNTISDDFFFSTNPSYIGNWNLRIYSPYYHKISILNESFLAIGGYNFIVIVDRIDGEISSIIRLSEEHEILYKSFALYGDTLVINGYFTTNITDYYLHRNFSFPSSNFILFTSLKETLRLGSIDSFESTILHGCCVEKLYIADSLILSSKINGWGNPGILIGNHSSLFIQDSLLGGIIDIKVNISKVIDLTDTDLDSVLDVFDEDDDNDGFNDDGDEFPHDPTEWVDTDGDGVGDNADPDDDGDSWTDIEETVSCGGSDPLLANSTPLDTDGDGLCDPMDPDDDNDFIPDVGDAFPLDACASSDLDGDGMPDSTDGPCSTGLVPDPDLDGDGVNNTGDWNPFDPTEWVDTDGDGIGDNQDPDDDNDGVPDDLDQYPLDPSEWGDADGDGMGDNQDPDDDNDGYPDLMDAFPYDPSASVDTDGDGMPDGLHPGWTSNLTIDMDDDGDGYNDTDDAFPLDASECCDFDGDGIGDNADQDADDDGWDDVGEVICGYDPLNATSTPPDADGDGICDPLDNSSGALSDLVNAIRGGRATVTVFLFVASTLGVAFLLRRRAGKSYKN